MRLNLSQRKSLGEYCGNLSIAWLAGGVITPFVTKQSVVEAGEIITVSVFIAATLLLLMLLLMKEKRRK